MIQKLNWVAVTLLSALAPVVSAEAQPLAGSVSADATRDLTLASHEAGAAGVAPGLASATPFDETGASASAGKGLDTDVETAQPLVAYRSMMSLLPYGYRTTIEAWGGSARNLKSYGSLVDGGMGMCGQGTGGFDLGARLSLFFGRRWGAFLMVEGTFLGVDEDELRPRLTHYYERHQPGVSLVLPDHWDYCGFGNIVGPSYVSGLAGVVWRHDVGPWSFRGRLGAGLRRQSGGQSIYYTLYNSADEEHYKEVRYRVGKSADRTDRIRRCFAYSPSLQVCLTPHRHMFFSCEVAWTGTMGHLWQVTETTTYQMVRDKTEIDEWVALTHLTPYDYVGPAVVEGAPRVERQRISMGNFLNVRFGIGWNIGFNRNAR